MLSIPTPTLLIHFKYERFFNTVSEYGSTPAIIPVASDANSMISSATRRLPAGFNENSISFCLAGNFNKELPTPSQASTLKRMVRGKMSGHRIPIHKVGPHRKFQKYRTCYGTMLPDNWIENLINPPKPDEEDEAKKIAIMRNQLSYMQRILEALKIKYGK